AVADTPHQDDPMFQSRRQFMRAQAALWVTSAVPMRSAWAQPSWPAKPLHLIVTFAPGGVTDSVARVVGEQLQRRLGQPVIVENRPGAAGNIGAAQVARSEPDGYSMVLVLEGTIVVNPHVFQKLGYDPMKDLVPV